MVLRPNFTYVHFFIFFLYRYLRVRLDLLSPTMHFLEPLCQFMILINLPRFVKLLFSAALACEQHYSACKFPT